MVVQLAKDSIDLGIVITDSEASLAFYRDLIGLVHMADTPMPPPRSGTMHRMQCGTTVVKLVKFDDVPEARPARGGLGGATGFRYFTMIVTNLAEVTQACTDAGCRVPVANVVVRPGVTISMVEDPDGNWVEFVEESDPSA